MLSIRLGLDCTIAANETLSPPTRNLRADRDMATIGYRFIPHKVGHLPNKMTYYAHTADDEDGRRLPESHWQSLSDHLRNVARLAKRFAGPLGLAEEAELAGLLHDLGKYQLDFQKYLSEGKPRTPHAAVGASVVAGSSTRIANVIASHHAGLYDWPELEPKLVEMRNQRKQDLAGYLATMAKETLVPPPKVPASGEENQVQSELRTRLLFSALVDADYLDTEAFHLSVAGKPSLRGRDIDLAAMATKLDEHLTEFQARAQPSSLNTLRRRINEVCAEVGKASASGIFSLTVPTGGSKTLSSASFALCHALKNGFERVIYVIPYTSIIEQNARVFAAIFGSNAVLEHHSLADWTDDGTEEPDTESQRKKLAAENWDAPFIVTTNVQFFESLLSHKTSACRKLHRLVNSVIIFDECQTFPPDLLAPTLERLKALVAFDRSSLVFCTATQPAFRHSTGFVEGFPSIVEIIPDAWKLHECPEFRRTKIVRRSEPMPLQDLAEELRKQPRALVVVNTRRQAWELFSQVRGDGVCHLSTLMCPAHRFNVLDAVKLTLRNKRTRCLVISTQLVEAGVDLDFPKVYRALAPLDSIIQAAGRCNREGKLCENGLPRLGEVVVFELENTSLPGGAYRRGTELAPGFLPEELEGNVPPASINSYFQALYQVSNRDKHKIAQLCADQCYRQIGEKYRWIESDTEMVLTDYSESGKAWQHIVRSNKFAPVTRPQIHAMARYCVNLPKRHVEHELLFSPKLIRLPNGLVMTQESYDPQFGYNHFGDLPPDLLIL